MPAAPPKDEAFEEPDQIPIGPDPRRSKGTRRSRDNKRKKKKNEQSIERLESYTFAGPSVPGAEARVSERRETTTRPVVQAVLPIRPGHRPRDVRKASPVGPREASQSPQEPSATDVTRPSYVECHGNNVRTVVHKPPAPLTLNSQTSAPLHEGYDGRKQQRIENWINKDGDGDFMKRQLLQRYLHDLGFQRRPPAG